MNRTLASVALAIAVFTPAAAVAQKAPPPTRLGATGIAASDTTATARIIAQIRDHDHAVSDVEYLSAVIGPRLTGSDRLLRANAWAESTFKARGFTNVHLEPYVFGPSWTRGLAYARLLRANGSTLSLAAMGWSPPTPGLVRGDALLLTAKTIPEFESYIGRFTGRVVIIGQLPNLPSTDTAGGLAARRVLGAIKSAGALALFLNAGKVTGLTMTGGPVWRLPAIPRMPVAFVASKDYDMLVRLLQRGERVPLEVNLPSTTSAAPVRPNNTVAELRGSEYPDQVVILGAHLDSWDLGAGATDNGTGVGAVMGALTAIREAGLTPKRTIRVVLFSGEEQGELGSRAYVKAHASELGNIQAVLVHDLGTGRVRGWALQGREDARPLMGYAIAPLNDLGVNELPLERGDDSDHAPFAAAGVPAFLAVQDTLDYFSTTHHSQYDTYDHVRPDDLREGAMALAVTAWELANMPERLPHVAPRKE
jgi:carboxypeptidase Q